MRHTNPIIFIILAACSPLLAQVNPHKQLQDAFLLEQEGQFAKSAATTKLAIDSNQLAGIELGRAHILLGVAQQQSGNLTEAQAAFERALRILQAEPDHASDYAAALENYAALHGDFGELAEAKTMWLKALRLHEQTGDHTTIMRSLVNLAGLTLAQNQPREAQEYLEKSYAEMRLARDLVDGDLSLLAEAKADLALAEGRPSEALTGYQMALEISLRTLGERHWLTGWDYMLRGNAYAHCGDIKRALSDMQKGLNVLDSALGRNNPKYFAAQWAYSRVLDQAGSHLEAAQQRDAAEKAGRDFYGRQCARCTINVNAFR